jgi:hypothetical protein
MRCRFKIIVIGLIAALIAGCAAEADSAPTIDVMPTGTAATATATPTAAAPTPTTRPIMTPEPTLEVVPTIGTKTPRPTLAPTSTPNTMLPADLSPGLVLSQGDGDGEASLIFMDADQSLRPLLNVDGLPQYGFTALRFDVSPDGKSALYTAHDDIWLLDSTGQATNLTNTPDVIEVGSAWWGSDRFVFYVRTDDESPAALYTQGPEGRHEIIAADQYEWTVSAVPSPDGERIAIQVPLHVQLADDPSSELWMYHRSRAMEKVDLTGFEPTPPISGGMLSWSPDGTKLGMAGLSNSSFESVFVTIDLEAHTSQTTARLPYEYVSHAALAYSAPRWSPDGSWSVFFYRDGPLDTIGLYLVDETGLHHLKTPPVWDQSGLAETHAQPYISPDGKWVIIETGNNGQKLLFRTDTWEPIVWWQPDLVVEGWMTLP